MVHVATYQGSPFWLHIFDPQPTAHPMLNPTFQEDLETTTEPFGHVAVGQNQWYHLGVGAPPILVHWGYGILTNGHVENQKDQKVAEAFHRKETRPSVVVGIALFAAPVVGGMGSFQNDSKPKTKFWS